MSRSDATMIVLDGELDIARRDDLEQAVSTAAAAAGDVVLDLRAVTFLDSSGLGAIARITGATETRSARVTVVGASRRVRHVLELAGIDRLVDLVDCPPPG